MGTCAFCIPLLLLFKEKYTRMELDAANIQARGRGKQDQEPLLSSGGVQPADYLSTSASSIVWIAQMIQDAGLGVVPDMMQLLINGVNLLNHSEFLSFDSKLCLSVSPIFVARPKVYLPSKLRIFLSDVCNPCSIQANDYFLVSKIIPLSSLVIMYLLPCLHETHLTWGKLIFLLYCVTFSIVKWHLAHVNVSRVNMAFVFISSNLINRVPGCNQDGP